MARALHARLYLSADGKLFSFRGKVPYQDLIAALLKDRLASTLAERTPTPQELGIHPCDGQLCPQVLHNIQVALHRWGKELSEEKLRARARRRRASVIASEQVEVKLLGDRLAEIRQKLAAHKELLATGGCYFLDAATEATLAALLAQSRRSLAIPPAVAWLARMVFWLSGECAARRFIRAAEVLLETYPKVSLAMQLDGFQRALQVWRKRSEIQPARQLRDELAAHVAQLSPELTRRVQLSVRLRGRTMRQHCDLLLTRCAQSVKHEQRLYWQTIPAHLAALVACDGSAVPIPQRCLTSTKERTAHPSQVEEFRSLAHEMEEPGYDALLRAIDELAEPAPRSEYGSLRRHLVAGQSLDNIAWLIQNYALYHIANQTLDIASARRLVDRLEKSGLKIEDWYLPRIISAVSDTRLRAAIERWVDWLASVSPRSVTPKLRLVLENFFRNRYLPLIGQVGWFEKVSPALLPLQGDPSSSSITELLQRLANYQQLLGHAAELPKSLRKMVDSHEREAREREHLRAQLASGSLSASAAQRWQLLEARSSDRSDTSKLRRAAEEAFLKLGVETQLTVMKQLALARSRDYLGEMAERLSCDQLWQCVNWLEELPAEERTRLRRLVASHRYFGSSYKQQLPENQPWIAKAAAEGFDLASWFAPPSHRLMLGQQRCEIHIACDIEKILLMGEYFDTCLGFGGVNNRTTITNAYDANKQVVFVVTRDSEGRERVLARMLLAISRDWKLVRYRLYMAVPRTETATRTAVFHAVTSFAAQIASDCGLPLADNGAPETIGEHFWYDDGTMEWPARAYAELRDALEDHASQFSMCVGL